MKKLILMSFIFICAGTTFGKSPLEDPYRTSPRLEKLHYVLSSYVLENQIEQIEIPSLDELETLHFDEARAILLEAMEDLSGEEEILPVE